MYSIQNTATEINTFFFILFFLFQVLHMIGSYLEGGTYFIKSAVLKVPLPPICCNSSGVFYGYTVPGDIKDSSDNELSGSGADCYF